MWPTTYHHRNITIKQDTEHKSLYSGITKNGLQCTIHKVFGGGSTGYIVIPEHRLNYETIRNKEESEDIVPETVPSITGRENDIQKSFINYFIENGESATVHGGITYSKDTLCNINVGDNVVVVGFDTSHHNSPRFADMKFMTDELIRLDKWLSRFLKDPNYSEPELDTDLEKLDTEDYFSYALRVIEHKGRKCALPAENEYNDHESYISEVFYRIRNNYEKDVVIDQEIYAGGLSGMVGEMLNMFGELADDS